MKDLLMFNLFIFKFQFPYAVLSCYFTFIDGVCIFLMTSECESR